MDGRLREQLETALRAVFSVDTLRQWLQYKMDVGLYEEVVGEGRPESTTIFELVSWAERRNRLEELVEKALADHSDQPLMKAFGDAWQAAQAAPPVDPATPPPPAPALDPPGPMFAFVTGTGFGEPGRLAVGTCVLLERPDRLRQRVRGLVDDALHDPMLRTNAAIAALKRRTFDYTTDDDEIRDKFIELLTVLSFQAYAYYAPPAPGRATAMAGVLESLLADRLTNDRSRRFEIAVDRGLPEGHAAIAGLVAGTVARLNREHDRGVAGAEVTLAAADEPAISVAGYVTEILSRRLEGPSAQERRTFERLHPQKIRLIHEIGTAKFFRHGRPLR